MLLKNVKAGDRLRFLKFGDDWKNLKTQTVTVKAVKYTENPRFIWIDYTYTTPNGRERTKSELFKADIDISAEFSAIKLER